jgi:hypothetical protein
MDWEVQTKPVPDNPSAEGKNESGVVVYLVRGTERIETSRVLFVRRNAKNKSVGFKRQLLKELDKAYEAVEVLNDSYVDQEHEDSRKAAQIEEADKRREKFIKKLQEEHNPQA